MLNLKYLFSLVLVSTVLTGTLTGQNSDSLLIRKIYSEALSNPVAYRNLGVLCNQIGGRLCGSAQAEKAVQWTRSVMDGMGLDSVWLQPAMVEHWERGSAESGSVRSAVAGNHTLTLCAIGGSVATPASGLATQVVEVKSFDDLARLGRGAIEGKTVFFNRPADPTPIYTFESYGGSVDQRARGAMRAGWYGAAAVLVRSATPAHDNFPHTGNHHYADTVKAIPAFCLSTNCADSLATWLKKDPALRVSLKSSCKILPEKMSYNVIGEIRGTEFPEQVIVIGGHLDSWDIGQGAHDDGAGVVQSIEVLRLFRTLGIRPRHTIRAVAFMDEEYGQRGAKAYADSSKRLNSAGREKHLAAIEADRGGDTPYGFSIDGNDADIARIAAWKNQFEPYGIWSLKKGGSGVDIRNLKDQGALLIALVTDSQRYFDFHHSANDTYDKIHPRELQLGAAAMAELVWLLDRNW